jgi:UDP-N-acetylmuramate dehydrogenase
VTAVAFRLSRRPRLVLDYPGVRQAVENLGTPSLETVRQAVGAIRAAKLPDPAHVGNAGSFFKNPVIGEAPLKAVCARFPDLPVYPQAGGGYKVPAGWLIERCGWKGRSLGRAAVHGRQALVLVNLGGAKGREILDLAQRVQESVFEAFGIQLEREVEVVGL